MAVRGIELRGNGGQLGLHLVERAAMTEAAGPRRLPMADAEVWYYPAFLSREASDALFADLLANAPWSQERIRLYGKVMDVPRETAWYGDRARSYSYSGITATAHAWSPSLLEVKSRVEAVSGVSFNGVLLNLYRDGRDSVAWHSDDERELGPNPIIGSLSLGETRKFEFRHKFDPGLRHHVWLSHGDYLIMKGATQSFWSHQIPKENRPCGKRINLTFRVIC